MWHEARKQERLIRGMIVDYRRRAERRKDFYEKIKAEPTQFLQLHGRPCKIHLDPAVAAAGEGPAIMMPWQGDSNNMIDRFDVRAHLDYIPEIKNPDIPPENLNTEERQCNYERYRILAQNAFLGISEDKFLQQLAIEEQFGVTIEEKELQKEKLNEKKGIGVAIGYNYSDPGAQPSSSNGPEIKKVEQKDSDDDSDLEIIDVDLSIDVNKMEPSQAHELNAVGPLYGMAGCDLFSFLTGDADDAEHQKQLLREEKEKALFSGRKSRRERRAHRDKKLTNRVMSPPSYAAPSAQPVRSPSRSVSRTPSPDTGENIQFITSFGGEDEEVKPPLPSKPLYADKLKQNLKKAQLYSEVARNSRPRSKFTDKRRVPIGPRGPNSRSRSFSRSRSSSSRSRSRSRTTSRSRSRVWRSRSYSKSRSKSSRSRSRSYRSRSRSRSWSRNYRRRSKSPTHSGYRKCDSRSMSRESNEKNVEAQPAVPRYYGRNKEDNSSSELSIDSDSSDGSAKKNKSALGNKSNTNQNQLRLSGSSSKVTSKETLTLKEKLKRKMQAQLSRQLRADKRAEAERVERESRRQARRDHEMRELAIKLRRKQREMRHQNNRRSSDDDSVRSHSESSSRGSHPSVKQRDVRSRSRSASSQEKHVPVWETNCVPTSTSYHSQIVYTDQRKDDKKTIDENRSYNYPNKFDRSRERGPNYESQSRCGDESGSRQDSESRYDSVSRQVRESRYASETRQEIQSRYDSGSRQEDQRRYHDVTRQDDQSRHGSGTRQDGQSRYDSGMRQDNESRYGSRIRQDYQSRYDDQSRHEAQAQDRWSSKSFSDRRKPFSNKESYREGSKNSENFSGHTTSRNNTDNKEMYNRNKVKLVDY